MLPKVIITPALCAQPEPSVWSAERTVKGMEREGVERLLPSPPPTFVTSPSKPGQMPVCADPAGLRSPQLPGGPDLRVLSLLLPSPPSLAQARTRPAAEQRLTGWNLPSRAPRHTAGRRREGRRRGLSRSGCQAVLCSPRGGGEQPPLAAERTADPAASSSLLASLSSPACRAHFRPPRPYSTPFPCSTPILSLCLCALNNFILFGKRNNAPDFTRGKQPAEQDKERERKKR